MKKIIVHTKTEDREEIKDIECYSQCPPDKRLMVNIFYYNTEQDVHKMMYHPVGIKFA